MKVLAEMESCQFRIKVCALNSEASDNCTTSDISNLNLISSQINIEMNIDAQATLYTLLTESDFVQTFLDLSVICDDLKKRDFETP